MMRDRIDFHKQICDELNSTYVKKNTDYGNSFGNTFRDLGIISAVTRISDKYNRLVSLSVRGNENRKVSDETLDDTLLDLANYAIMTLIERRMAAESIEESIAKAKQIDLCNIEY